MGCQGGGSDARCGYLCSGPDACNLLMILSIQIHRASLPFLTNGRFSHPTKHYSINLGTLVSTANMSDLGDCLSISIQPFIKLKTSVPIPNP